MPAYLLLLAVPAFAVSIPLLLWEPRGWPQLVGGLGLLGLGISAWIDTLDNCAVSGCIEDDPLALSGGWALSTTLVAVSAVALSVRLALRHGRRSR